MIKPFVDQFNRKDRFVKQPRKPFMGGRIRAEAESEYQRVIHPQRVAFSLEVVSLRQSQDPITLPLEIRLNQRLFKLSLRMFEVAPDKRSSYDQASIGREDQIRHPSMWWQEGDMGVQGVSQCAIEPLPLPHGSSLICWSPKTHPWIDLVGDGVVGGSTHEKG